MAGTPSRGTARFSCPPNFTATPQASESSRFSLDKLTSPDTELWLIQAPVDFAPDCLNGRLVPLSGSQVVKGKVAGKRLRYRVLSSSSSSPQAGEATLLAPSREAGGRLTCAPAPKGSLRILEGSHPSLSGTPLYPIPTSPPPQIPPGLRPRFCAFGGSLPVTGPASAVALRSLASGKKKKKRHMLEASAAQEAVDGHGALEVDTAWGSSEMDVGKRKKQQQQSDELEVTMPVVTEPTAEMLEPLGVPFPSASKKKKKKPKEMETAMLEPEEKTVELELRVKTEPLEDTVLSPTKKKKRQTGTERMEPVEGKRVELQVKEEPQEEAIPLPSSKKKKKKGKECKALMEPGTEAMELDGRPLGILGEMMEPEPAHEIEPRADAAVAPTQKRRKKEKWQNAMMEPKTQLVEPELPGDLEPQGAPASAKRKKEREHRATEPGLETADPQGEAMEPEARADPASTKKRKKWGLESEVPATASQEEMLDLPLNLESGEVAPLGRKKKRKKLLQDPA